MADKPVTARVALETFIDNVVSGSKPLPHVDQTELPSALDGRGFNGFQASADHSVKQGDTFDCGHGLTAEVIGVTNLFGGRIASYSVKFYYLN